jgi:UDP-N-acetylmuramoyl-L-alanyl-D-glutamate--2,6-diaminopimelate ligase
MNELSQLLKEVQIQNVTSQELPVITGIKIDSREITEGDLFVALPGTQADGHQFIPDAVKRGAAAVIGTEVDPNIPDPSLVYLQVEDSRQALAQITAAWYGYPARQLVVIGVTGTDGKTTTANLIFKTLEMAGVRTGLISTVNARIGTEIVDTGFHVTTPEAADVQRYLAEMVQAGLTHVVLEATSHGLAQKRVAGCEFDLGIVTNITHEHLDYHGNYSAYFDAKAELFRLVADKKEKSHQVQPLAVLNKDDRSYSSLRTLCHNLELNYCTYSQEQLADFQGLNVTASFKGLEFDLQAPQGQVRIKSDLLGAYNASNILAAAAACHSGLSISLQEITAGVQNLASVPGRMELIHEGQEFTAIVDFAHTPYALEGSLSSAREMTDGRVFAVFGSAGLRDKEKRRLMAEVSADLADVTILTAEDPRTEDLDTILDQMAEGLRSKGKVLEKDFLKIPDRGDAIRKAFQLASESDLVIVCGKGHEQSMCFGDVEYAWDDRTAVRAALGEMLGKPLGKMPYLPTSK